MRRKQRPITLAVATSGAAALVLGIGWLGRSKAPLDEISTMVAAAEAQWDAHSRSREAAWGETHDGAAFAHYDVAKRLGAPLRCIWWREREGAAFLGENRLSPQELQDWRKQWAPVFAHIRDGTHCRDARSRPDLDAGWIPLSIALHAEAELRIAEGCWWEAVEAWLDCAVFLLDHDRYPGIHSTWTDARLAALPHDVAELLDRGTIRLDVHLLAAPDLAASDASEARRLLDGDVPITSWAWGEILDASEWGFDPAQRRLAALAEAWALIRELPATAPDYLASEAQWATLLQRAAAMPDPLVGLGVREARTRELARCWSLAHLRALRIGLAAHLGRPLPEFVDPWSGAPLRVEREDGAVVVHPAHPQAKPVRWSTHR